ncbi:GGDEF domain-containing protein [Vibrio parahaemolyticus]|uniref:GGDEF domain-containing protein n=1 Tax=Vibrio parahaemolyticus TaxID=670 RepID=UPI0011123B87
MSANGDSCRVVIISAIGVASWSGIEEPINAVLKNADDALYAAKHNGRNRTEWKSEKHFLTD